MTRAISDLVIRERTGERRELRLSGSALPHGTLAEHLKTRRSTEAYQGSVHATQQVFGGQYAPMQLSGVWRDYHLTAGGQAHWQGQELRTAWDLRLALRELWLGGQQLDLAWEGLSWRGVIDVDFDFEYREDIRWALTLDVAGPGEPAPHVYETLGDTSLQAGGLLAGISSWLSSVQGALRQVQRVESEVNGYIDRVNLLRRQVEHVIELSGEVAMTPARLASRLIQSAEDLKGIYSAVRRVVQASDHTVLAVNSDAASLARAYRGQRDIARASRQQGAEAARTQARLQRQVEAQVKTWVRATEGADLRRIALDHYGSADRWRVIAEFNGFDGSRVPPGTIVLVPELM